MSICRVDRFQVDSVTSTRVRKLILCSSIDSDELIIPGPIVAGILKDIDVKMGDTLFGVTLYTEYVDENSIQTEDHPLYVLLCNNTYHIICSSIGCGVQTYYPYEQQPLVNMSHYETLRNFDKELSNDFDTCLATMTDNHLIDAIKLLFEFHARRQLDNNLREIVSVGTKLAHANFESQIIEDHPIIDRMCRILLELEKRECRHL